MTHSGDAAEQIVRMSLEGVEFAARITGTAAKEITLLLLAALKSPDKGAADGLKLKGKERLTSMLKSGKALEIFSVRERDLKTFAQEAKRYGIVYCVLRNRKTAPDGLCDIMVKADDAPKINRLVERFKFAAVDKAKIESEIVQERAERADHSAEPPTEPETPEINDVDTLSDELPGTDAGKPAREKEPPLASGGESRTASPAMGEKPMESPSANSPSADSSPPITSPSEPFSENRKNSERRSLRAKKPSVREELREITASQKAKQKEPDAPVRDDTLTSAAAKLKEKPTVTHQQPPRGKKTKKAKGR